jgi:hypothetical protein
VIVSGIIVVVIGYMSGLTVLKAIGGILIVVMWGSSRAFWPSATRGFEVSGADLDAGRQVVRVPKQPPLAPRLLHLRRNAGSGATSVRAA